jgi:Spy/CpxP family protein refolding chaperone
MNSQYRPIRRLVLALTLVAPIGCEHQAHDEDHTSEYAGQESREIKTLSTQDLDDLRNGRGWGLAKAAELNGVPGPVHVLEMTDEIALTESQAADIKALYEAMNAEAIVLGEELIERERAINAAFVSHEVTEESLATMVGQINESLTKLRVLHLSAHLRVPKILTPEQVARYNELRGYLSDGDPCASVPEGHDPEEWKKHNDCG